MDNRMLKEVAAALGVTVEGLAVTGAGSLPSAFRVSDLAAISIGLAGQAVVDLLRATGHGHRPVTVDRRLASFWFSSSLRPKGWSLPPIWDPLAGDYATADGWIRLHTNAPHHRAAALKVLNVPDERGAVAAALMTRRGEALETALIAAGGCAARMLSSEQWRISEAAGAVTKEELIGWKTIGNRPWFRTLDPARPLKGVRVLDLTRVLAGPVATRFLANLGADVLRIDPPDWDEPAVAAEVMVGKRSARLNLKNHTDLDQLIDLMADADILIHGYRKDALDGLGLGADRRRQINPGLIDVGHTAYGWHGPWTARRGFDSLVQMSCGIAEAGQRHYGTDKPKPLPVQALDHATGYLIAAATLRALLEQVRTGRIMEARLSLVRTAMLLMAYPQGDEPSLMPEEDDDLDPTPEATGWGPAYRLRHPLTIGGVEFGNPLPAMPLGKSLAEWRGC